jgi:NIPSNAP
MITMCIRYTLDLNKMEHFEKYARNWPEPIKRCGGELLGYFLPTKLAGPTNSIARRCCATPAQPLT